MIVAFPGNLIPGPLLLAFFRLFFFPNRPEFTHGISAGVFEQGGHVIHEFGYALNELSGKGQDEPEIFSDVRIEALIIHGGYFPGENVEQRVISGVSVLKSIGKRHYSVPLFFQQVIHLRGFDKEDGRGVIVPVQFSGKKEFVQRKHSRQITGFLAGHADEDKRRVP